MGSPEMVSKLKRQFREALIKKIDRCSESSCPRRLLSEFFTEEEKLDIVVDGYLNGHFSLDSIKEYTQWFDPRSTSHLRELLAKKPSNRNTDRRRELVLNWLKEPRRLPGR
jgi:hypothetical protein